MKWSKDCILVAGAGTNQEPEFKITDAKFYDQVVTQDNIKPFKNLESGFKRKINWNKYLPKTTNQARNRCLDFLIDASFQEVNRLDYRYFKKYY